MSVRYRKVRGVEGLHSGVSHTQYRQYNLTAMTSSTAEFRYSWVNAMVGYVRQLFDVLQLNSSHQAIMIDELNLTLLAGVCESFEQRHTMVASLFVLFNVLTFSE